MNIPANKSSDYSEIKLGDGSLNARQIESVFDALPLEITFTDENDIIVYYSRPKEPLFSRKPEIIGTKVQDCHSEKSIDLVNSILNDFKTGKRKSAEFWFEHDGRLVLTIYRAVTDSDGSYLGCLETAQDISEVKKITGQKIFGMKIINLIKKYISN